MRIQILRKMVVMVSACIVGEVGAETGVLRPLSTDRPDTTESPFTVEEGRYQVEVEIGSMTVDGGEKSYGLGEVNFKFGVDERTDVQIVMPLYEHIVGGAEGFGDMQIRVKRNLWGNDGGETAMAVMPYIQMPTGSGGIGDEETQGGVILPFAMEGAGGWGYGFQAQFDLVADGLGGRNFSFLVSATASRPLTESLGAFFEIVGIFGEGDAATSEQYFNTGVTWAVSESIQLDGGVRVGLSSDAEDFSPFCGVSVKF